MKPRGSFVPSSRRRAATFGEASRPVASFWRNWNGNACAVSSRGCGTASDSRASLPRATQGRSGMQRVKAEALEKLTAGIVERAGSTVEEARIVAANLVKANLFGHDRSEEHTSELQSLMRSSYAVFCLKKKNKQHKR